MSLSFLQFLFILGGSLLCHLPFTLHYVRSLVWRDLDAVMCTRSCNKLFDYGRHRGCDFTVKEYHLSITNGCFLLFYVKKSHGWLNISEKHLQLFLWGYLGYFLCLACAFVAMSWFSVQITDDPAFLLLSEQQITLIKCLLQTCSSYLSFHVFTKIRSS